MLGGRTGGTMRLYALVLILGLSLLTACGGRRGGGGGGGGGGGDDDDSAGDDDDDSPDDDDASPDDDDDETPWDDDDATSPDDDDDETPMDDDDETSPDDDDAVDDDDATFPDDDDTAPDDDDATSSNSSVTGELTVLYYSDVDGQNELCRQVYSYVGSAVWGSNPPGASCPSCTGYITPTSVSYDAAGTTCGSSQLGAWDLGDPLTDAGNGGNFALPMAVMDINTATAINLALNDDGSRTAQTEADLFANQGVNLSHFLMIEDSPGNFFTDDVDLDSAGAALVPSTDWMPFWNATNSGANTLEMSGPYGILSPWAFNGVGEGPSGPEVIRFALSLDVSP